MYHTYPVWLQIFQIEAVQKNVKRAFIMLYSFQCWHMKLMYYLSRCLAWLFIWHENMPLTYKFNNALDVYVYCRVYIFRRLAIFIQDMDHLWFGTLYCCHRVSNSSGYCVFLVQIAHWPTMQKSVISFSGNILWIHLKIRIEKNASS